MEQVLYVIIAISTLIIVIGIAYNGYHEVASGTASALFFLGKFARPLKPGPYVIIPILNKTQTHSTKPHQQELPNEQNRIDRVSEVPPVGMNAPYRITHPDMKSARFWVKDGYDEGVRTDPFPFDNTRSLSEMKEVGFEQLPDSIQGNMKLDMLAAQMISEIAFPIEWSIHVEFIQNFIENVSDEYGVDRTEEVRRRCDDLVRKLLDEHLSSMTLRHSIYMASVFSKIIKTELEILVGEKPDPATNERCEKPWGIDISKAYIKSFSPGVTVNKAMANASAAMGEIQVAESQSHSKQITANADKYAAERAAEAAAYTKKQLADAERYAETFKGLGEANRIRIMAKAVDNDNARFIAALDVAEQVLPKTTMILTPGGGMDAIAAVTSLGRSLIQQNNKP